MFVSNKMLYLQVLHYACGNVALAPNHLCQFPLILLGPQATLTGDIDELGVDPQLVIHRTDPAFEDSPGL